MGNRRVKSGEGFANGGFDRRAGAWDSDGRQSETQVGVKRLRMSARYDRTRYASRIEDKAGFDLLKEREEARGGRVGPRVVTQVGVYALMPLVERFVSAIREGDDGYPIRVREVGG